MSKDELYGLYPKGCKIQIINMEGEPEYSGRVGVLDHIDDLFQLHGSWGGCALTLNDLFIKITD